MSARLAERGLRARARRRRTLVLLCVPDRAIAEVAAGDRSRARGSRTSAARRRSRRSTPHRGASALHPLQTFTHDRGPEQLDGAWAAVTGETRRGARGRDLARRDARAAPVRARDERPRALYHAGAAIASNYLVTLRRAAGALLEAPARRPRRSSR